MKWHGPAKRPTAFLERVTIAKGIAVYKKKFFHSSAHQRRHGGAAGRCADRQAGRSRRRLPDAEAALRPAARGADRTCPDASGRNPFRHFAHRGRISRNLPDSEIDFYLDHENFMDKAGAYAIQGRAAIFVERIEGCFFNVMGFPLNLFYRMLERARVNVI